MRWTVCCRGRQSACPKIQVENGSIHIRDDYGGMVKMALDEFDVVVEQTRRLDTRKKDTANYCGLYFPDYIPPE